MDQPETQPLPEPHSEFPLSLAVDSWWALGVTAVLLVVAIVVYRRRFRR